MRSTARAGLMPAGTFRTANSGRRAAGHTARRVRAVQRVTPMLRIGGGAIAAARVTVSRMLGCRSMSMVTRRGS